MREIKFRGKRFDNKKFVIGSLINGVSENAYIQDKNCTYEVETETVGQYTGLKDKNGVKIFEGDEVEYDNGTKARVVFKEGGFCGYDGYASSSDEAYTLLSPTQESPFDSFDFEIEVIGNIHENK